VSTRVKVPLKNMGMIEKAMARGLKNSIERAMKTAARQCIPVLSARVADAPPASDSPHSKPGAIAFGTFLAGWEIDWSADDLSIAVYNKAVHAGWVDKGVRASKAKLGKTAVGNIEKWLIKKGIQFNDRNGKPLSSRRMAWIIVASINYRKDWRFKPRRVGLRARDRIAEIFKARMREALARATAEAVASKGKSLLKR